MAILLRQSTNSQEIPLGIFVDKLDGVTLKTGLTILASDIKLWKNGATSLVNKNSGGASHMGDGIYYAVLDDTDTNTLGTMVAYCNVSGEALPVKTECAVLPQNVYDALVSGSTNLVTSAGEPTLYSPTSLVKNSGGTLTGDYTKLVSHDDDSLSLTENNSNGISLDVIRASSSTDEHPSLVRVSGYYAGSASHSVAIQVYNYVLNGGVGDWETKATMKNRSTPFDYIVPLSPDNDNGSGEMKIRFLHNTTTYVPSHVLYLDYISWEKVAVNSQMQSDIASIYTLLQDVDLEVDEIHEDVNHIHNDTLPELLTAVQNVVADVDEGAIAEAVWEEPISNHLTAGTTGSKLNAAASAAGGGATAFEYTVELEGGIKVGDADVWVTQDVNGNNVLASGKTDQNGKVTFYLDPGPVYVWTQKSGYNFENPDLEEVV